MRITLDVASWRVQLLYSVARGDQPVCEIEISQGIGETECRFVLPLEEAKKMGENLLLCVETGEEEEKKEEKNWTVH